MRDAIATLATMVFFIGVLPIIVPLLFIWLIVGYGVLGFLAMCAVVAAVVIVVDHKLTRKGR